MPHLAAADLFSLSIPEKIQLVEDIWDSIAVHPEMVELSPQIKSELDKRLEEHEQHPDDISNWDDVRSRLWRMLCVVRSKAEADMAAAAQWYERQSPGLGTEFIRAA